MSKIKINQNINQKQTQTLLIKPKMLQSLEILAAPILELETFLAMELQKNPMLEMLEDDEEDNENNEEKENNSDESEQSDQLDDESDEMEKLQEEVAELSEVLDSWSEYNTDHHSVKQPSEESDFEERYINNPGMMVSRGERDEYLEQLSSLNLSDLEHEFAEDMIDSINEHGFLPEDYILEERAQEYQIAAERGEEIHRKIMQLSPQGITARNIQECLIVQLDVDDLHYPQLRKLIEEDFDDLVHMRYKKIASKYSVSEKTVLFWKDLISHLDPKPGLRILPFEPSYVVPDVIIKKIGNRFEIISHDFTFSHVKLSRNYLNILKSVKNDKDATEFVREKINAAKFIIKSVYLRGRTLERVVRAIIKFQPEFFHEENGALRPLTYAVIADELQVNESTISRVVRSKYAETPYGMMCLKDFFTSKAGKDENYNSISRHNVEGRLQRLIEAEDKENPLSDLDISKLLKKDGLTVSRRVVNKYRKKLGILNSHLRSKG